MKKTCGFKLNKGTPKQRRCGKETGSTYQSYCKEHKREHDLMRVRETGGRCRDGAHVTHGPRNNSMEHIGRMLTTARIRANKAIWDVYPEFNQVTMELKEKEL